MQLLFRHFSHAGLSCRAVQDVVTALGLPNVTVVTQRAETLPARTFDLVIGRAVVALPKVSAREDRASVLFADLSSQFLRWAKQSLKETGGVLYFKGTRWKEELEGSKCQPAKVHDMYELSDKKVAIYEGKFILHFEGPIEIEDHIQHDSNTNMHAGKKKEKKQFKKRSFR